MREVHQNLNYKRNCGNCKSSVLHSALDDNTVLCINCPDNVQGEWVDQGSVCELHRYKDRPPRSIRTVRYL